MKKVSKRNLEVASMKIAELEKERNKKQIAEQGGDRMSIESRTRIDLHKDIYKKVRENMSKEEILNYLKEVEKYQSLSEYFESYINDNIRNYEKEKQGKRNIRPQWGRW